MLQTPTSSPRGYERKSMQRLTNSRNGNRRQLTSISRGLKTALSIWKSPPPLTVSQWADAKRRLSSEASAEPGAWSTDRAPYQRGIMDAISDDSIREIWFMKSAQVGWTEILNNVIGFF